MARPRLLLLSGLVACLTVLAATAQAQTNDAQARETPPAHVSYTDGRVLLEYEATTEALEPNTPLEPGDRVRTETGRAEIVFGDGTVLHLDEYTTIDLLSDRLVRLLKGRVIATVNTGLAGELQIDAPTASVRAMSAGEYRVSLLPRGGASDLELSVVRGRADLFTESNVIGLAAGQRAVADVNGVFAGPWPFNSADFDTFTRWSAERLDARRGPTSYGYLPDELHHYAGDFDRYGYWRYEPVYGYVWFPRVVHGWRPYFYGRWKHYHRWGWTWVGGPRWAWPTHHYGRWGITSAGAWFWIPGLHWSGAFVHWGIANQYVAWCPLGFDNRPVFGFWKPGFGHHHHGPWRGWTVVHRSHFGAHRAVHRVALDGHRVVTTQKVTFVTQAVPPAFTGARHRRLSASSGSRVQAVPRGTVAAARSHPVHRSGRTASIGGVSGVRSGGEIRTSDGRRLIMPDSPVAASTRRAGSIGQAVPRGSAAITSSAGSTDTTRRVPDVGVFSRRSGRTRAVERTGTISTTPSGWRAEDIPVYRGGRLHGPGGGGDGAASPRARTRSGIPASPAMAAPPPPDTGSIESSGSGGGVIAVPRGRGPASVGSSPSSRGDGGRSRGGSIGVPSGRSASSPSGSPSIRSGGGGGRARQSSGGGSLGTAVPRGSGSASGGGGGRSSSGGGGRRR